MRPTPARAALAALTATAALGACTGSAQAAAWSPFGALAKAKAGSELKISEAFSIKPTKVKKAADGSILLSNATVLVGELTGTGVTAKATPTGVVLSGGTYLAPTSITENTLKPSAGALKVGLSDTAVTALSGELTSTKTAATAKQQSQSLSEDLIVPAGAVPAAPTSQPWTFKLGLDLQGLSVKASAGYASLDGRIYWTTGYDFAVSLNGLPWNGGTINVRGAVSGKSIFSPNRSYSLKGSIVGAVQVAPRTQLLSGSVEWGEGGFKVAGTVRLQCSSGYLDASATGTFTDVKNFKVKAKGLASDCTFGKIASFDEQTFDADVTSKDGVIKYDAGFSGARIDLYSRWLTPDAEVITFLSGVGGRITNDCSTCTGDTLRLSFEGTGNGQVRDWKKTDAAMADPAKAAADMSALALTDRTVTKTSFSIAGTMAGQFDLSGGQVSKVSLKLSGLKLGVMNALPGLAMEHTIKQDTVRGFTL